MNSKALDSMIRMIQVIVRKGYNLEEVFKSNHNDGKGIIDKDIFINIIKNLGLPYSTKVIQSLARRYAISSLHVDYEIFLQEILNASSRQYLGDGDESIEAIGNNVIMNNIPSSYSSIIHDLKRMLREVLKTFEKSEDDVYRMFSRWDYSGTGSVTTTQFFRVLSSLHISFNDVEQDAMVELLDSIGTGKIDFDSVLSYCFSDSDDEHTVKSVSDSVEGHGNLEQNIQLPIDGISLKGDESLSGGESLAGVNTTGEVKSSSSGAVSVMRRPRTASAFRRGDSSEMRGIDDNDSYISGREYGSPHSRAGYPIWGSTSPSKGSRPRPLTASARVLNVEYKAKEQTHRISNNIPSHHHLDSESNNHYIQEDLSDEDESAMRLIWGNDEVPYEHESRVPPILNINDDKFQAPQYSNYPIQQSREYNHDYPSHNITSETVKHVEENRHSDHRVASYSNQTYSQNDTQINNSNNNSSKEIVDDSKVDIILSMLRSAITSKLQCNNGTNYTLRDIFNEFDTQKNRYITCDDLCIIAKLYHMHIPENIVKDIMKKIAIDGINRACYGEFITFINDEKHNELINNILLQICEQLEQQGQEYQYLLFSVLSQENKDSNKDKLNNDKNRNEDVKAKSNVGLASSGLVSATSFAVSLTKIGISLDPIDINRIVARFDTHGLGQCSVSRFMRMVQNSQQWKDTLDALALYEEATEEAQVVRKRIESGSRTAIPNNFDKVTVDMAEYLGIRILSEPHLLWIVSDAVNAKLPVDWSIHQDKANRTFFYNAKTGVTRWDHPLDSTFRQLRNIHRKK
jgi:Ca2+-binding EF-hand superfamily protein